MVREFYILNITSKLRLVLAYFIALRQGKNKLSSRQKKNAPEGALFNIINSATIKVV